MRPALLFALVAVMILLTGMLQSWNVALGIVNMGLVSAIMALGVNMQWGFAGLFNVGVMGFVALGGLGAVLVGMEPVGAAWAAGGLRILAGLALGAAAIAAAVLVWTRMARGWARGLSMIAVLAVGFWAFRAVFDGGVAAVEAVDAASAGYLGGLGLPIVIGWPVGGLLAAGAAWIIGKTALGLRSDYLAIATLGIAEIIIAIMKNEDWLSRGVKNVIGLPRPVPYEVDLQGSDAFVGAMADIGADPVAASTIAVKLAYAGLFAVVLLIVLWLAQAALASPWGRMMRAIRDNETAAEAMGKDVTRRHLQIFILGSAVCGIAGAMMTTLDGQLTPSSYQPLRFTFLVWVMVIVGGSGNNWGAVLGGFLIWFLWVEVEPLGRWVLAQVSSGLPEGSALRAHLLASAAHMRLLTMGLVLLAVLRFSPRGLIPGAVNGPLIALLAAGGSARMRGGDKTLEEVSGRPLLRVLADRALATGAEVIVTLPPDRPARGAALAGSAARACIVADAGSGMAASFRAVARVAERRAVLVMLADMPEIETADLLALIEMGARHPDHVVRAGTRDGRAGQPVLFPAGLVPRMAELRGDAGARRLVSLADALVCPLPGVRALVDLDTPEDWAAWRGG